MRLKNLLPLGCEPTTFRLTNVYMKGCHRGTDSFAEVRAGSEGDPFVSHELIFLFSGSAGQTLVPLAGNQLHSVQERVQPGGRAAGPGQDGSRVSQMF